MKKGPDVSDKRGSFVKSRVAEQIKNNIREHISRFPNVESHYCRKESQRMYLDKTVSLRRMYRLYVEECNTLNSPVQKFWLYEKIFNTEFNLGFYRPKKDLCAFCETFKFLSKDDQDIKQAQFDIHQQRKRDSRIQKSADKEKAQTSDRNKYRVTLISKKSFCLLKLMSAMCIIVAN